MSHRNYNAWGRRRRQNEPLDIGRGLIGIGLGVLVAWVPRNVAPVTDRETEFIMIGLMMLSLGLVLPLLGGQVPCFYWAIFCTLGLLAARSLGLSGAGFDGAQDVSRWLLRDVLPPCLAGFAATVLGALLAIRH